MKETNSLGYSFTGNNAEPGQAQVRFIDSSFASILMLYASRSETIVEIGTWIGQGSTYCLWKGLTRQEQRLWTVEVNLAYSKEAASYYQDPRMTFLWGHVSNPEHMPALTRATEAEKISYENERTFVIPTNPCVLDQLPEKIDLCLMDGGNWNGIGDFKVLQDRCRWIALDDTNERFQRKNAELRLIMLEKGWKPLYDNLQDREGVFLAQNPNS